MRFYPSSFQQLFPPTLSRFMVAYRRNTVDEEEEEDAAKRMRTEGSVESEGTIILNMQ